MGSSLLWPSLWMSCIVMLLGAKAQAPASGPSPSTSGNTDILLAIKAGFASNTRLASWVAGSDPCGTPGWEGVVCTDGVVTNLTLTRSCDGRTSDQLCSAHRAWSRLVGAFPTAVTNLTGLQVLDLGNNSISGPLPPDLGRLPLTVLVLNSNGLNGTLPSSLGSAVNMTDMLLDMNSFSGNLPASFANLTSLKLVGLNNNNFKGPLPAFVLQTWTQLLYLNVGHNGFNGSLPAIGDVQKLFLLALSSNDFSGPIPAGFGSLNELNRLEIANNKGINGSIPSDFGATPSNLQYLDLSNNSLSGSIPNNLGNIVSLQQLLLAYNDLTGPIPASFSNFSQNLQTLTLNSNNLSGPTTVLFNLCQGKTCYYADNPLLGAPVAASPPSPIPPNNPLPATAPVTAPASNKSSSSSPIAAILGAVGGGIAVLAVAAILFCCCRKRIRSQASAAEEGLSVDKQSLPVAERAPKSKAGGIALGVEEFSFDELTSATDGWHMSNILGEGGYGKVYKGQLHTKDGPQLVAIKRGGRNSSSHQGEREFLQEISSMSRIRHKHLVRLVGFCDAGGEQCLVYEYMVNGTVQDHLWGRLAPDSTLDWPTRIQIALGAAKGLEYLHTAVEPPIIHRDVKLTNILLDAQMNAKVADFGICKLEEAQDGATTVKGTLGYLDPYYVQFNELTIASDVYSFGMNLLEIVAGRPVLGVGPDGRPRSLLQWAVPYIQAKRSAEIADPRMGGNFNPTSVHAFCALGLACIRNTPAKRPTMAEIRVHLERIEKHALPSSDESDVASDVTPYDMVSLESLPSPMGPSSPLPEWLFASHGSTESVGPPMGFIEGGSTVTRSSVGGQSTGSSYVPSSVEHSAAWEGPITTIQPR